MVSENKIIVGAHYGLRDWLAQRITALVMLAYVLLWIVVLIADPGTTTYLPWRRLMTSTWMSITTLIFVLALLWHAWIGLRDVLMDYIKSAGLRLTLQVLVLLYLLGMLGWALRILWSV